MGNLDSLKDKYTPIIQKIIDDNQKFYAFAGPVKWSFYIDNNIWFMV